MKETTTASASFPPTEFPADELQKLVTEYRRQLHRIPEQGFHETETQRFLQSVLEPLHCRVEPVLKTGLTAFFDFGREETLAFRSDMDALPIREATGLPFASTRDGVMHACGHDGHMANLLGFALLLDRRLRDDAAAPFNALLIFQPAEEIIDGAHMVCETGILDRCRVRSVYGLHLWPFLPAGEIASRPGPMMARSTEVNVDVTGRSAHCGEPEKGRDALLAGCRFVEEMYHYRRDVMDAERDPGLISFGRMESGTVRNAIAGAARIEGSMRTFYDRTWDAMTDAMQEIGERLHAEMDVTVAVDCSKGHPAVINDEALYGRLRPLLAELPCTELPAPVMIAEDFSFYQRFRPGVFFFLGTGTGIPLHSDRFTFDETILPAGVHLFERLFLFAAQ
ncbi:MAG: M20 metallopeptidase family protein [Anaerovoracaceae bacterium]|jgi:amidohydrolase